MAPRWLSALVLAETLMGAMGFGPMASSTPATKQAAFGAARLGAALSSRARISGSVRRLVCPLAVTMGRRRRGAGDQRSRWSTRVASDNPNAPQPEGEDMYLGTGQNRLAKIEALANVSATCAGIRREAAPRFAIATAITVQPRSQSATQAT